MENGNHGASKPLNGEIYVPIIKSNGNHLNNYKVRNIEELE